MTDRLKTLREQERAAWAALVEANEAYGWAEANGLPTENLARAYALARRTWSQALLERTREEQVRHDP